MTNALTLKNQARPLGMAGAAGALFAALPSLYKKHRQGELFLSV